MLIGPRTRVRQGLQRILLRTVIVRRWARTWVATAVERRLPSGRTARQPSPIWTEQIILVSIYRRRNAPILAALIDQLPPSARILLWCLDDVDSSPLADYTVGHGPGSRWVLLNRLLDGASLAEGEWVVVADDDVYFSRGDVSRFVRTAARAGFDLSQPAHGFASTHTYQFNRGHPLSRADLVGFVEIGPIFALGPHRRSRFLPFPEGEGMGWGTEVEWSAARRYGARLGLVHSCRIVHCGPVGATYSRPDADAALRRVLDQHGIAAIEDLLESSGTWRLWQRRPPWVHDLED